MNKINIFDEKHINLLCPYHVEYIWDVISFLNFKNEDVNKPKTKYHVLKILEELFENRIVYVYEWLDSSSEDRSNFSTQEIIESINNIWTRDVKYPDFYNMIMLGYNNWYRDGLINLGLTPTTNWIEFVKNNIGDLEKWIEKNKPKD